MLDDSMFTSPQLAIQLKENGCKFETKYYWRKVGKDAYQFMEYRINEPTTVEQIPAYDLLWDICVKYAKEMFGEGYNKEIEGFEHYSPCELILNYLQQGKKKEAELCLWEFCKFNPKNQ